MALDGVGLNESPALTRGVGAAGQGDRLNDAAAEAAAVAAKAEQRAAEEAAAVIAGMPLVSDGGQAAGEGRGRDLGLRLHAPTPLFLWRDIHLALAETGATVRPEDMPSFALTRPDPETGRMTAALAGEVVLEALHVSHLWVEDGLRRQGVGSALLAAAEARGRAAGARRCHLETRSDAACAFYQAQGYSVVGRLQAYLGDQDLYFLDKRF